MAGSSDLNTDIVFLSIMVILVIELILILTLWVKLSGMKRRYHLLLNGESKVDIEQLLIKMQEKSNQQQAEIQAAKNQINQITNSMMKMKAKTAIKRYNAFGDNGNDLSFSVAILDEYQDGIILTGIHNREQTYVYAKPIEKGQSQYTLSPEEKEVITQILQKS